MSTDYRQSNLKHAQTKTSDINTDQAQQEFIQMIVPEGAPPQMISPRSQLLQELEFGFCFMAVGSGLQNPDELVFAAVWQNHQLLGNFFVVGFYDLNWEVAT